MDSANNSESEAEFDDHDLNHLLQALGIPSLLNDIAENTRPERERNRLRQLEEEPDAGPRLYPELVSEKRFYMDYRITKQQFHEIHELIRNDMNMQNTTVRRTISTQERLLMCLRFLATGKSLNTLGATYGLGFAAVRQILLDVCNAIRQIMGPIYMPKPTPAVWLKSEEVHRRDSKFPNCCGALYGRRVNLTPINPDDDAIIVLAIVDVKNKFVFVDVGPYTEDSTGGILDKSVLGKSLENGQLELPAPGPLTPNTEAMPHVIVTEDTLPLRPNLMRPYNENEVQGNENNEIFNFRLHRALYSAEIAFSDLKARWRAFNVPLPIQPDMVESIILAACCLQNYLDRENMPPGFRADINDLTESLAFTSLSKGAENFTEDALSVRNKYNRYFCEEGALPWQWAHIRICEQGMDLSLYEGLDTL